MTDDSWPEIGALATPATSEATEAWLLEAGAVAVTLRSAFVPAGRDTHAGEGLEHAVLEPAPGEVRLWERLVVVGLFAQGTADEALAAALAEAALTLGIPLPEHRLSRLADTVWERVWMSDFAPMRFGPRLWICPTHGDVVDARAVTLRLDPGLAFGSGTHPTTAQCLEWLGRGTARTLVPLADCTVVDYGCGSGVLAIAAARLGAREVHATDIDPQALAATAANALANGVAARLCIVSPDALAGALGGTPVDVLLANILLGPLEALLDTFAALVRPGGTLVLSGLLEGQIGSLRLGYNRAFDFAPARSRDGWALLEATRRSHG